MTTHPCCKHCWTSVWDDMAQEWRCDGRSGHVAPCPTEGCRGSVPLDSESKVAP